MNEIKHSTYTLNFPKYIQLINSSNKDIDLCNRVLTDLFTDIIIYTSILGVVEMKEDITYYLNIIMDEVGLEKLNYENNYLFYEIIRVYDRFPFLKEENIEEIKKNIGFIDNIVLESYHIGDKYLTKKQKDFYQSVIRKESIVFSAPTSYGKTSIMFQAIYKLFQNNEIKNVLFIVPTKSLINEYWKMFRGVNLSGEKVSISDSPYDETNWDEKNVLLFTQERTLIKFSNKEFCKHIDYVIVDEAQSIAKIVNKRNLLLLKALRLFDESNKVFLAPFVEHFTKNVLEKLDLVSRKSKEIFVSKEDSLVTNNKYIIDLVVENDIVNIKDLSNDSIKKLSKPINKEVYGYIDAALCIYSLIKQQAFKEGNFLFFVASKAATIQMALAIMQNSEDNTVLSSRTKALIKHLEDNIHEEFSLINMIKRGVAYHNAYLDDFTKRQLEYIVTESDDITVLCSTSTISKGVNITAKNIITFIKTTLRSDLPEIEFKNTLGRSARLHITNQGNLYFVIMKQQNTRKYLDEFIKDEAFEIKIKDLDVDNKKDRTFINTKFDSVDLQNLLRDKSFSGSTIIESVKNYLISNEITKEELISQKNIPNMDFLLGILEIDEINRKVEELGKENAIHLIDCWESIDDLENLIKILSNIYDWDKNVSHEKKSRMLNYRFLAVILHKIVHNMSIKNIVDSNLKSCKEGRQTLYVNTSNHSISNKIGSINAGYEKFSPYNSIHVNSLIINTLDQVQHLIEFDLKRFLQDFYYRVLKIYNISHQQVSENTERFLEYTTIDPVKVKLMKLGISDSFALNFLIAKKRYYEFIGSKTFSIHTLKHMILENEGIESPIYYAIADRM